MNNESSEFQICTNCSEHIYLFAGSWRHDRNNAVRCQLYATPRVDPLAAPTDTCLLCGHNAVHPTDGTCMANVQACSDESHNHWRRCGCECRFREAPAAPTCPTCGSVDREFRNLGCNGSYGILHDNCGTEPCPDTWHVAPAAPDERDKALARQILQQVITEGLDEGYVLGVLATVRTETRNDAIAAIKAFGVEQVEALESASAGKGEG